MQKRDVHEYLEATKSVEGWFFPIDALLFAMLDELQKREGISGNLFEIGVHHGKTALFLARMAAAGESVGVCDVFDMQELNRDRSGAGNRAIFERHLETYGVRDMRIFTKLSSALTSEETTTNCRFVHIDGGHRPEDVLNDLHLAERALLPDGIVAVDDVFNPNWPGVSEGFYRYKGELVPIAIGGNKVLLVRRAATPRYYQHFQSLDEWRDFIAPQPFVFGFKEWLGRNVLTMIRLAWVDLDPTGAARLHGGAV